jgi:hypothetical protein
MSDSEEGRKLKRARDSVDYGESKKRFPSSTFDLLPINSDTLIAATRYNGIVLTADAGHTWTSISSPGLISKLTIDNQKQVWGLYSWRGIHEADRSILYSSHDLGKTWQEHEINTKKIFPADFYSGRGEILKVIDYQNRIYQLTDDNPELKWRLVDSIRQELDVSPWVRKEFVMDSKKRRWTFDEEGIFWVDKDTLKMY